MTLNLYRLVALATVVVSQRAMEVQAAEPSRKPNPEAVEFFEKKIRPILVQECYSCHSEHAKSVEAGLRLDSQAGMLKGGENGPAIVPGKPEESNLVKAIRYGTDFAQMPPKGKLSSEAIADLERWIADGAPDPRSEHAESAPADGRHWAFQPLRRAPPPQVKRSDWPLDEIDRFVLARLEERGLSPAPDADRAKLIRRLSFDLIGLPPTFSEVETFVNDPSRQAVDVLVDRLLASPQFGERWARHWLDVARYADTKGYVFNEDRSYPKAYTYRDWVIQAFNGDMPYDRFLMEQIAGDQMEAAGDENPLAAMGFLTLGRRFIGNVPDIIDDRIDVVTRGAMALTVTCARCHDHKYDPIPTKDYYSLYGVFASSKELGKGPSQIGMIDARKPHNARVFVRGNPDNPGEEAPRRFLQVLAGEDREPFRHGSGRLELARAIADRDNPLTARVIVNRVWGHLFGVGLVRTPSDFGTRSDPPSHPELLDDLALQFVDDGWSIKKLIRRIVTSRIYRQDSDDRPECSRVDPENLLIWRMNRRRLDFEALRDSILAVSGQLENKIGGPSVALDAKPFTHRRTLYAFIDRQNLPGMFRTFDFASPDTHSPQRFNTTVPQQALFLLNSPFILEQSKALVGRSEVESVDDASRRIRSIYHLVHAREPTDDEVKLGVEFVTRGSHDDAGQPRSSSWEAYAQVLMLTNEFAFVD